MRTSALHRPPYHSGCAAPDGDGQLFPLFVVLANDLVAISRWASEPMTAFPEESTRSQMLEAGAVGFLSKPFNDECLINCLATALKSHNTQRSPH